MRPYRLSLLLAIVFAPLLASAQPLADKVPADTLLYVGWRGADAMGPGYAQSHLKSVLDASDFSQLVDEFFPQLMARIAQADPDAAQVLPIISALSKPMWKHPTTWCFHGVDLPAAGGAEPFPRVFILCDAGTDAPQVAATLRRLVDQIKNPPVPVNLINQGNLVGICVGNMPPTLDALIKGNAAPSLAADAGFKSVMAPVTHDPVFAFYINIEGALAATEQAIKTFAPPEVQAKWPSVREALGLQGLKRFAYAGGFDGKDWTESAFLASPAPRQGFLANFGSTPISADVLKLAPKTSVVVSAARFNLLGFVNAATTGLAQFDPGLGQQAEGFLGQLNQMLGFDLRKDFLGAFGEEWVAYTDPNTGGYGLAGSVLVNHLADPARAEQSLSRLEATANGMLAAALQQEHMSVSFQTRIVGDATLHYLAIPLVTPTWTISDGNFYLALYPQAAAAALDFVAKKGPSILDNADFIALRKRLNGDKADAITFVDLARTAPVNYGAWLAVSRLLGIADLFGVKSPIMVLPPLATLMEHLAPGGSVSWADDAGWHVKSLYPFPGSTLFTTDPISTYYTSASGAAPAFAVSILLPSLSRARETANRVKSGSNLRQIGQATYLYASENKGQCPPDLGTILKTQDVTPQVFLSPRGTNEFPDNLTAGTPDQRAAWINEHADYVYLGKGKMVDRLRADEPLAYEKLELGDQQGTNILYGDGHVGWVSAAEAARVLKLDAPRL